jgi:hypothetical protein
LRSRKSLHLQRGRNVLRHFGAVGGAGVRRRVQLSDAGAIGVLANQQRGFRKLLPRKDGAPKVKRRADANNQSEHRHRGRQRNRTAPLSTEMRNTATAHVKMAHSFFAFAVMHLQPLVANKSQRIVKFEMLNVEG